MHMFSIITASKNSELTIGRCIKSLENQSFISFEWIVIDGESKDNTINIIKNSHLIPNKIIIQKPAGIYNALNQGVKFASGKYILFLHSDDFFYNRDFLNNYAKVVEQSEEEIKFLYSNVSFVNNNEKIIRRWHGQKFSRSQLLFGWMPPHPTVCVSSSFLRKNQITFSEKYKISADYEWCLKCLNLLKDEEIEYVKLNRVIMNQGGASNGSVGKYLLSFIEDLLITRQIFRFLYVVTIVLKRARKLSQFIGGIRND